MLTCHHAHRSSRIHLTTQSLGTAKYSTDRYCHDCDTFWTKGHIHRVSNFRGDLGDPLTNEKLTYETLNSTVEGYYKSHFLVIRVSIST